MDKRLLVNLSKTVVMSVGWGMLMGFMGALVLNGNLNAFWPVFGVMVPFNYWLLYKRKNTWEKSLERGAAEFGVVQQIISKILNNRNNEHVAGV